MSTNGNLPNPPIKIGIVEIDQGDWRVVSMIGHLNPTIEPERTIYAQSFPTREDAQAAALEIEYKFETMYPGSVVE